MTAKTNSKLRKSVIKNLDRDAIIGFLADLVEIPSATGHELQAATFIRDRLQGSGIDARIQQFDEDRANVIATLHGSGNGPTVMLNDT